MTDGRRVGQAQRRRIGAPSNVYDDTIKPPSFGVGDQVRAGGRYGVQQVVGVLPSHYGPSQDVLGQDMDGHGYVVSGGKKGRQTTHSNISLKRVE